MHLKHIYCRVSPLEFEIVVGTTKRQGGNGTVYKVASYVKHEGYTQVCMEKIFTIKMKIVHANLNLTHILASRIYWPNQ